MLKGLMELAGYRILITGSSGYIGSVLTSYLQKKGHSIIGMDLKNPVGPNKTHHFHFIRTDITERDPLERTLRIERPDMIIHLAFILNPLHDPTREEDINVNGTENLFTCAMDVKEVGQFIHFSSAAVYGAHPDNPMWIKEDHPLRPGDYLYGAYKVRVEKLLSNYKGTGGLRLTILRLCSTSGPSCKKSTSLVRKFHRAPFFPKFNNQYCPVQFLHEEDLCRLIGLMIDDDDIEGIFNIAPPSFSHPKEMFPKKIHIPVPLSPAKKVLDMLWSLGISPWKGAALDLCTYGIIIDPSKLSGRYGYGFKYTTLNGFQDTIRRGTF